MEIFSYGFLVYGLLVYAIGFIGCVIYQRLLNDYYIKKYTDVRVLQVKFKSKEDMILNSSLWFIFVPINMINLLMGQDKNQVLSKVTDLQELHIKKREKSDRLIKNMSKLSDDEIIKLTGDIEQIEIKIEKIKIT